MVKFFNGRTLCNGKIFKVDKTIARNLLQIAELKVQEKMEKCGDDREIHFEELIEDIEFLKNHNKDKIRRLKQYSYAKYYRSECFRNSLLANKIEIEKKEKLINEIEQILEMLLSENEYRGIINEFTYLHNSTESYNALNLDVNIIKIEHLNV